MHTAQQQQHLAVRNQGVLVVLLAVCCAQFFALSPVSARPVNWTMPNYHFDYVNNQGQFSVWKRLAEIDVGDGLTLPIQLNFTPGRSFPTPTLNMPGTMIGLLVD